MFRGGKSYACVLLIFVYLCHQGQSTQHISRHKREDRPCKDKYRILRTHSACKPRSPNVVQNSTGVSTADIQVILREHNNYRSAVSPPAANMMKMYWDQEVASIAQAWAETCSFTHDENWDRYIPGGLTIGQNIGKGYQSWPACIKGWNDEVKNFQYGSNVAFELVGHYTQLVWGISNKLGCGVALCGQYTFHVCNYAPAGNIGDHNKPYKNATTACADCSGNCANKLCDCSTKACENEGTIDPATCGCTCKWTNFQIQPVCKLNCSDVKQPYMCGTGSYDKSGCQRFSGSVPSACPLTCGICPYASFDYSDKGGDLPDLVENAATMRTSMLSPLAIGIVSALLGSLTRAI